MSNKAIVLDANILIRAVLGTRVRELILKNAATVKFFSPDVAYADARSKTCPVASRQARAALSLKKGRRAAGRDAWR